MPRHEGPQGRPRKYKVMLGRPRASTEAEDEMLERADIAFEREQRRHANIRPFTIIRQLVADEYARLGAAAFSRTYGASPYSVSHRLFGRLNMWVPTRRGAKRYLYGHFAMAAALRSLQRRAPQRFK